MSIPCSICGGQPCREGCWPARVTSRDHTLVVNSWSGQRKIHRSTCRTIAGRRLGERTLAYISVENAQRILVTLGFRSWSCKKCRPEEVTA